MILDVLQHLVVDPTQSRGTSEPNILPVTIVLVIVLPDPGAAVAVELASEHGLGGRLFDDVGIRIDLLALLGVLRRWQVEFELLILLLRETSFNTFLCPPLLLLLIEGFLVVNIADVEHAEISVELGDDNLQDDSILRGVQVGVLQRAVVDHLVDLVYEFELVALQLISAQHLHDVVLANQFDDFGDHL